jgi:hypothetical protein
METWQDRLRATLARNIAGLRLAEGAAAALLESEYAAVMEATEAGLPFGAEAAPPQADTEPDIEDVIDVTPPPKRKALSKK